MLTLGVGDGTFDRFGDGNFVFEGSGYGVDAVLADEEVFLVTAVIGDTDLYGDIIGDTILSLIPFGDTGNIMGDTMSPIMSPKALRTLALSP